MRGESGRRQVSIAGSHGKATRPAEETFLTQPSLSLPFNFRVNLDRVPSQMQTNPERHPSFPTPGSIRCPAL
jgi:hypothetical protein